MPKIVIIDTEFMRFGFENRQEIKEFVETDDKLLLGLSMLLGRDYLNNRWKELITDSDGRLLVSSGQTKTNVNSHTAPIIDTTNQKILDENLNRKVVYIHNVGASPVYLGFGSAAVVATGFKLDSGMLIGDDVFYGEIHAIMASGTAELRVSEMS